MGPRQLDEMATVSIDTLVDAPRSSATRLGAAPMITPWSVARLTRIFHEFSSNPSFASLMEARLARQCLSQFWLMAPVDELQLLYGTVLGECTRLLLAGPLPQEKLTRDEVVWRNALSERLMTSFSRPENTNILLALMPFFAPGQMRVSDPMAQVPEWLREDYARLFDPQLFQRIWKPVGLLSPPGQAYGKAPTLGVNAGLKNDDQPVSAAFESSLPRSKELRLARQGGATALAMVQESNYQSRMNGLINLHVIDPEDITVQDQLGVLRRQLGQIWLDAKLEQLEPLYRSHLFGQLYRDLMASGFPRMPLGQEDKLLRNQLARLVADMSQPGSLNALLAVLPFYPPGKITFGGGEQHMPAWLLGEIATIYGQPAPVIG
jgi:hypothetical protein